MRHKALRAIQEYEEGQRIKVAVRNAGFSWSQFWKIISTDPDLRAQYDAAKKSRADVMMNENSDLAEDLLDPNQSIDPRRARVAAEIREKLAGKYDRERFGERVDLTMKHTVDIAGALEAARQRVLLPRCDLKETENVQVIDVTPSLVDRTTDCKSDAPNKTPVSPGRTRENSPEFLDPFDD